MSPSDPVTVLKDFATGYPTLIWYTVDRIIDFYKGTPLAEVTVETAAQNISAFLQPYFLSSKLKPSSCVTYQSRFRHVLLGFYQAHSAWKAPAALVTNAPRTVTRPYRKRLRSVPEVRSAPPPPVQQSWPIALGNGKEGSFTLPMKLTKDDVKDVFDQLAIIKILLTKQCQVAESPDSQKTEEPR